MYSVEIPALSNPKKKHLHAEMTKYAERRRFLGVQRGITFSVDDHQKFVDFCSKIRLLKWLGHIEEAFQLTASYNKYIKKNYDDHRPQYLDEYNMEGYGSVDIHHNKITTAGVVGMVNLLSMQSDRFYIHASMGRNTTPEAIGQKFLFDEEIRISVITDGGMVGRGNLWNHVANMGYGAKTDKYYEFGIHDLPEDQPDKPSRMLARSILPNGLDHTQNDSFVTTSHTTIFVVK